jgi:tRNA threonylcarbamoyladenosine biosynthesis protein TsaE
MKTPFSIISDSEETTRHIAALLVNKLECSTCIALFGTLGCGKTAFTKGFAEALGIAEPVTSPTFNLIQEYVTANNTFLFHLDLYRINVWQEALSLDIDTYLHPPQNAFSIIEWSERILPLLEENRPTLLQLYLEHVSETEREIRFPASHKDLFEYIRSHSSCAL